jgi:hypothetical protein
VAANMNLLTALNTAASLTDTVNQNALIWKTKEAQTPKILYVNQNMEKLYFVEPDSSTVLNGARQNNLDIHITGLKMRYKYIFNYIYGLSFPSLM